MTADEGKFRDRLGAVVSLGPHVFDVKTEGPPDAVRRPYARILAQTLADPDEIWTSSDPAPGGGQRLMRRYFTRREVKENNTVINAVVVAEELRSGWTVTDAFAITDDDYVQCEVRRGYLNYRRRA